MGRPRAYSDDELVSAVAAARSWRAVLRALGMAATSSSAIGSVRRRADELGLDYGHFTGGRRWTDQDLVDAVAGSRGWDEVAATLGLAEHSGRTLLKGHAARLGLDTAHLSRQPVRAEPPLTLAPDRANLSKSGTLMAATWFAMCGCDVTWPLEPARYDLVVDVDGMLHRVQVKTGTVQAGSSWTVWLSTTRGSRRTYDPEEIDLFFVVAGDLTCYLIPVRVVAGLQAINVSAYQDYRVATS